MLHRLFNGTSHRLSEADLKSHLLLHGDNCETASSIGEQDVRIIIAQDLGDKAKVVLLDTQKSTTEVKPASKAEQTLRASFSGHASRSRPSFPPPKEAAQTTELLTELMFGTVPLSYRGTSVRVHPLSSQDAQDSRSFLFTKVFTVNVSGLSALDSPHDDSSAGSLSSSYGSVSGMRNEYPFPMTTITGALQNSTRDRKARERPGSRTADQSQQRPLTTSSLRHHSRAASGSNRSDTADAAPYVPFTKTEGNNAQDEYFSGWLPSPGPVLSRRRRSTGTNGSTSPGSLIGRARYQAAMCAIGVVFTVPGSGNEHSECAVITRYWQMLTRAIYALQSVVYDEVELALNFVTANGAMQTPCSRTQIKQKHEAQIYQRGKKLYVALAQNCLKQNTRVYSSVDNFRARLAGGINLPEIQRHNLQHEAPLLMDELSFLVAQLDRKESKFILFTLLTQLAHYSKAVKDQHKNSDSCHRDILRERFVIVSDDAVLARRLIFCIARLFFRGHNEHLREATDYGLVWPSRGLLHVSRRELLRKRKTNQASSARLTRGWDIPRHSRPLSIGSHNMLPISPSIYHRPPSTASNNSSRGSSWKPSWSWFNNGSRTNLHHDDCRSDTRTMQTSWTSADFADIAGARKSPRSCSPAGNLSHNSPASPASEGNDTDQDDEDEDGCHSVETTVPSSKHLHLYRDDDGTVNVDLLQTVSLNKHSHESAGPIKLDQAEAELPLTGVLARFHPDMLLQAIPHSSHNEDEIKDYLAEEDLYIPQTIAEPGTDAWVTGASVVLVELGHNWRLRRLTRLTKTSAEIVEDADTVANSQPHVAPHLAESWADEILVDLHEPLRESVLATIQNYQATSDSEHVRKMIEQLHNLPNA